MLKSTKKIIIAQITIFIVICGIIGIFSTSSPSNWFVDDTLYATEIAAAAQKYNLPKEFIRSIVFQESKFYTKAKGKAGEIGLMQVLPRGAVADWARINKKPIPSKQDLYNPELNLEIGCWYLAKSIKKWQGYSARLELVLIEYNAGPKRANEWKPANKRENSIIANIKIPSTKKYVTEILKRYQGYLDK